MNTKNKKSSLNRKQRKIRKYTSARIKEINNYDDWEWSTTYFDDLLECNVCGGNTDDINAKTYKEIYGYDRKDRAHKKFWQCENCKSYVGCHKDTYESLGILADKEMRELKKECHKKFDWLWRYDHGPFYKNRRSAYYYLSNHLGIRPMECHFGLLDKHLLEKALLILNRKGWWEHELSNEKQSMHLLVTSNPNVEYKRIAQTIVSSIGKYFLEKKEKYSYKEIKQYFGRVLISTDIEDLEVQDVCRELGIKTNLIYYDERLFWPDCERRPVGCIAIGEDSWNDTKYFEEAGYLIKKAKG